VLGIFAALGILATVAAASVAAESEPWRRSRGRAMQAIYRYGMKEESMPMADMGYVVIDRARRVRMRKIDRMFGEHIGEIVQTLKETA
jgi:hypothetical protein